MLDGAREGHTEVRALEPQGELWGEAMQVVEARERAAWHELMSRRAPEQTEALQVIPSTLRDMATRALQHNVCQADDNGLQPGETSAGVRCAW